MSAVQQITNGKGVDYVIDGVGKDTFGKSQGVTKVHGWAVIYGFASGQPEGLTKSAFERALRIGIGELFTYIQTREEYQGRFRAVAKAVEEGWLRINFGPELSLAEAAQAHRELEARNHHRQAAAQSRLTMSTRQWADRDLHASMAQFLNQQFTNATLGVPPGEYQTVWRPVNSEAPERVVVSPRGCLCFLT